MMFQSYAIFPHMTVEQNVAFGLKQDQVAKDKIREKVQEALELVEMPKLAKRKPHQLSGGQRQRVAWPESWSNNRNSFCSMNRWLLWTKTPGTDAARSRRYPGKSRSNLRHGYP